MVGMGVIRRFVVVTAVVAVVALGVACIAGGAAAAEAPLTDRVPAGAMVYAGWAGRTLAFDGSYAGQFLQQFPLDEIHAAVLAAIDAKAPQPQGAMARNLVEMAFLAARHPAAVYVDDFIPFAAPKEMMLPRGALLIDLGRDRETFNNLLEGLLALLPAEAFPMQQASVAGVEYRFVRFEPETPAFCLGYLGDAFFLAVGEQSVAQLAALQDSADASLTNSSRFAGVYEQVAGDNVQAAGFMDVPALVASMMLALPQDQRPDMGELQRNLTLMGLGRLGPIASATRIEQRRLHRRIRIVSPAPHEGLLKFFSQSAESAPAAENYDDLPADAELLVMARLDLQALLDEARRIAAMQDPAAAAKLEKALMGASSYLGLSLEEQIIANLGPRVAVVSAESLGGPMIGSVAMIEIKDPQAFAVVRDRLEAMAEAVAQSLGGRGGRAPFRLVRTTVGDKVVTSLHLNAMDTPAAALMAAVPSWTISGNQLVVSAYPQPVMAMIGGNVELGLGGVASFARAREAVKGRPLVLSYYDASSSFKRGYGGFIGAAGLLANVANAQGVPVSATWLPSLDRLLPFVQPGACGIWADEGGVIIDSVGQGFGVPMSGSSVSTAAMGASILMPSLGRARDLARQTVSASHLRAIGVSSFIYQSQHGRWPQSLDELVEGASLDPKMLVSPISEERYTYIPIEEDRPGSEIIVAFDPLLPRHRQVIAVFGDSHVETLDSTDFQRRLQRQALRRGLSDGPKVVPVPRGPAPKDF